MRYYGRSLGKRSPRNGTTTFTGIYQPVEWPTNFNIEQKSQIDALDLKQPSYFNPPDNSKLCPVIYPVRQSIVTALAHSSVLPLRPTGMFFTSPGVPLSCSSDGIIPVPVIIAGATSLNVIPLLPILLARFLARPCTPAVTVVSNRREVRIRTRTYLSTRYSGIH